MSDCFAPLRGGGKWLNIVWPYLFNIRTWISPKDTTIRRRYVCMSIGFSVLLKNRKQLRLVENLFFYTVVYYVVTHSLRLQEPDSCLI